MTTPSAPLTPPEENALIEEITAIVQHEIPAGWRELYLQYCVVGSYVETISTVKDTAGRPQHWNLPTSILNLLERLRAGMYRPGGGTWNFFAALFTYPGTYSVKYEREREPDWFNYPAQHDFQTELTQFPRTIENTPDWLQRGAQEEQHELPTISRPELFDGVTPDQKPIITRPPIPASEVPAVLTYLRTAPAIQIRETGGFYDLLEDRKLIPGTIVRTDGTWVWPTPVAHYLEKYGISPDPAMLEHIRTNNFQVPQEIPEVNLRVAYAVITNEKVRRHRLPITTEIQTYLAQVAARKAPMPSQSYDFYHARVFDGQTENGDPVVNREPLTPEEKEKVLAYLVAGDIVLSGRGRVPDQLDPEHPRRVPVAWLTDGTWLWQPAVRYYLEKHDLAPDPAFLTHIRQLNYQIPTVNDDTRQAATRAVTPAPSNPANPS
ncbi:hypothetical protein [Actinoalloteichus hymeniacidonis]|uniref:Uncharacterized protein n=1 Tax=Actinoalloteichus hymeniacidonis TaxID=340345 RepID=A0AAC9HM58_9PSEU|nr:hypothetical protein [Actinoalloteichus hymeniacidonis]AOS61689.1 hypothetical protein TL08_04295 [Actinoalloteichus hymeniacidonis]MBB5910296.1 hypothetical protein [Actinoalloteichus hymeniacidonis]